MCDLTIAAETATFRQVGPMMGSFDAGFGTWYLRGSSRRQDVHKSIDVRINVQVFIVMSLSFPRTHMIRAQAPDVECGILGTRDLGS